MIACADKAHTVKGDGVAEACAVRTHAACTSTLVALRPPLRVCEPFFKISFLALGSRSTSGSCRVQTTGRRDATVSSSITSRMAHRLGSLGYQPGPSKPDLGVRCTAPTARVLCACDFATSPFFYGRSGTHRHNSQSREGVSCAAVLCGKTGPPVPVLHPGRRGG